MTADEIMAEPAGRRLDAWVQEKVFGAKRVRRTDALAYYTDEEAEHPNRLDYCWERHDANGISRGLPHFSTQAGMAWAVVEQLGRFMFDLEYLPVRVNHSAAGYTVSFGRHEARAETMPLAACRAGLLAVLGENE